jgi:hypothetical protein
MTDATVTPLRPPATKDVTGPLRSRRAVRRGKWHRGRLLRQLPDCLMKSKPTTVAAACLCIGVTSLMGLRGRSPCGLKSKT